jgi:hypothetical protein
MLKPWMIAAFVTPLASTVMLLMVDSARGAIRSVLRPGAVKRFLFKERRNPFDVLGDFIWAALTWPFRLLASGRHRRIGGSLEHATLRDLRERHAAWRRASRLQ